MESPILETAVYLLGNLFRIYIIMQLLGVFLNKPAERRIIAARYFTVLAFFIANSSGYLLAHWSATIILLSNVVGAFLISLFYNGRWTSRIFASLLIVALSVFSEDVSYYFAMAIGVSNTIIIAVTLSDLLLLFVTLLIQKCSSYRKGNNVLLIEWASLLTIPAAGMVLAVVLLENCSEEIDGVIGGSGLILINVMIFFVLGRLSSAYKEMETISVLEEQANSYKQQLEIIRQSESSINAVRHDMKNHIIVLQSYCEENDPKKIREYLNSLSGQMDSEDQYVSTGNSVIDSMLNYKLDEIIGRLKTKADYRVTVSKKINISDIDLCTVLGNLLDNAAWALEQRRESEREFELTLTERKNVLKLIIKNTYGNQIEKKEGVFLSTKSADGRTGQGLRNVDRVIEKYHGEIDYSVDKKWFAVTAVMFIS